MTNFNWYFTRDEIDNKTPSREDGVPLSTEVRYRKDGARFIINASNTLGLRYETTATGVVFFHRFYMIQSFRQFNRWVVSAACLLLAGKVEETPKKCRDIIKVSQSLLTEQQMAHFGSNPKDELMTHERILLQTIKFDLQVEHPYSYLLKFAKQLKGDKAKIEKLVQMAWTFMNDSLCTTLCLQWEPQAIAIAFIYLAGKLSKFDLQTATGSRSRSWWRQYLDTLDVHDLESICHQVLDIYGEEEQKSGEEAPQPPHPSQVGPQSSPATPQPPPTSHQQHTTITPQPPQAPPALQMSGAPSSVVLPHPTASYQQYATVYQQLTPTTLAQQPQARAALFSVQTAHLSGTPPLISSTQTTPIQPTNTPLAFSTLNVNVSATTPSQSLQQPPALQGTAVPGAIAGSAPTSFPFNPLLPPGVVQTTVSGSPLAQAQRGYGRGAAGNFPMQSFKSLTPLLPSGGGQPAVGSMATGASPAGTMLSSRPGMEGAYLPAMGRGTSPIPLVPSGSVHTLPRATSILAPQGSFPGAPGSGILATTNQLQAQSPIPGNIRPQSGPPMGGYKAPGGSAGWTR